MLITSLVLVAAIPVGFPAAMFWALWLHREDMYPKNRGARVKVSLDDPNQCIVTCEVAGMLGWCKPGFEARLQRLRWELEEMNAQRAAASPLGVQAGAAGDQWAGASPPPTAVTSPPRGEVMPCWRRVVRRCCRPKSHASPTSSRGAALAASSAHTALKPLIWTTSRDGLKRVYVLPPAASDEAKALVSASIQKWNLQHYNVHTDLHIRRSYSPEQRAAVEHIQFLYEVGTSMVA